jgi:hypothetical protein
MDADTIKLTTDGAKKTLRSYNELKTCADDLKRTRHRIKQQLAASNCKKVRATLEAALRRTNKAIKLTDADVFNAEGDLLRLHGRLTVTLKPTETNKVEGEPEGEPEGGCLELKAKVDEAYREALDVKKPTWKRVLVHMFRLEVVDGSVIRKLE